MATKIPQNVDIEDKLIGPLTLKQFLYVLGGAGLVFIAYQYYNQGYLFFIEFTLITLVVAVLTIAFAFVKINGFPFSIFILQIFHFVFARKKSLWHKDNRIAPDRLKLTVSTAPSDNQPAKNETNKSRLEELAQILDTGGKINTDKPVGDHIISNLQANNSNPESMEADLNIEDMLEDLEI